ncbi:MAG TPA: hypothetical protein DDW34_02080 [Clostridium sp.]|nr:hypothetical protein [Clostridium sp.]
MKNFLIREPPISTVIQGKEYKIASDFRDMLELEAIFHSNKSDAEKGAEALQLFFGCIPPDEEAAVEYLGWFFSCGREKESPQEDKAEAGTCKPPVYSFSHDGELFYAAFLAQYGIDLQDVPYLHWWKFIAMFNGLTKEHLITEVMHCRAVEVKPDMPRERKEYYEKMQKVYANPLPDKLGMHLSNLEAALLGDGKVGCILRGERIE